MAFRMADCVGAGYAIAGAVGAAEPVGPVLSALARRGIAGRAVPATAVPAREVPAWVSGGADPTAARYYVAVPRGTVREAAYVICLLSS